MSQQSIDTVNYNNIFEDVKISILNSFNKNKLLTQYRLGEGYCKDRVEHDSIMYDILKNANCDTIDLINTVQRPNFKKTKYGIKDGSIVIEDNSDKLYKIWLSKGNVGTIEDFFDSIVQNTVDTLTIWEDVEW